MASGWLGHAFLATMVVVGPVKGANAQSPPKPQGAPPSASCYEAIVLSEASDVRRVVVDGSKLDIRVEFQGASRIPFFPDGECKRDSGGVISCTGDCDGGSASMSRAGNGLSLKAKGFALNAEVESALPSSLDVDRSSLSGTFNLNPVNAQVCVTAFNSRATTVGDLQRGDFSPRVRRVKKYLSDLGILLQRPDWYFDGVTENALRAFQRSAGLPVSGVVDQQTLSRLRLAAQIRGGC
jgi:hypothetical protein